MGQYFPIVYVRGYAMTPGEVEQTFNMPHYGFNLGSTQFKLSAGHDPKMYIFESPVVRLMKDEGYADSFNRFVTPYNLPVAGSVPKGKDAEGIEHWRRTLWIFRYYDGESNLAEDDAALKAESRKRMDGYAADLAIFLNRVALACGNPPNFGVNLVAHSMGGLVARCYLQNRDIYGTAKLAQNRLAALPAHQRPKDDVKQLKKIAVRKFFTFGTPHKGISFRSGLGWAEDVRDLFGFAGSDAFGPKEMRRYLKLAKADPLHKYKGLDYAPPVKNVFSLIGTNHEDYTVRVAKAGVGPGSDGLVTIENAFVREGPRAFVHRSHSGPLGIVNSEAGYQNLTRFLFGDCRFKLFLVFGEVEEGKLPGLRDKDDQLDYVLAEVKVTIRGLPGYLHSRTADSLSALRVPVGKKKGKRRTLRVDDVHLYTGYFRKKFALKVEAGGEDGKDPFLRGAGDLRLEPHFTHDGWVRDSRYEGDWIMNDRLHFGIKPEGDRLTLRYHWASEGEEREVEVKGELRIDLPPKVRDYLPKGSLRLMFDAWS